jgi:hypothetical protein
MKREALSLVTDTRAYRESESYTNYSLVVSKITILARWKRIRTINKNKQYLKCNYCKMIKHNTCRYRLTSH